MALPAGSAGALGCGAVRPGPGGAPAGTVAPLVVRRCAITADQSPPSPEAPSAESWIFADAWAPEDEAIATARERAQELGVPAVSVGTGATLRMLAAALGARSVVEVGTGMGVSGAWLLDGMHADGILTSVDIEAEYQRHARETLHALGIPHARARLITGRALDVLPRLTDAAYDLVFIDGDRAEYAACLEQALRLLRPGGAVVIADALGGGRVPDPAQRDPETQGLRAVAARLRDEPRVAPVLLPVGDGLLVGVLREPPEETDA